MNDFNELVERYQQLNEGILSAIAKAPGEIIRAPGRAISTLKGWDQKVADWLTTPYGGTSSNKNKKGKETESITPNIPTIAIKDPYTKISYPNKQVEYFVRDNNGNLQKLIKKADIDRAKTFV